MKTKWIISVATLAVALSSTFLWSGQNNRRPAMEASDGPSEIRQPLNDPQFTSTGNAVTTVSEDDATLTWNRFRGPNGTGTSNDKTIPTQWSETKNLKWKTKLPGPGASSPVLTQKYIFLTSYTGYGEPDKGAGDVSHLKRHLLCIDRTDGKIVWTRTFDNEQKEDPYKGMGVPEHGYATNTPVTDGKQVFAFLGKSGVVAFDLAGIQQWKVSVGTESSDREWGSAASLTLYDDLVIVNAAEESQAIIALEKATGKEVWKAPASTLEMCYSTPAIVHVSDKRDDLVIAVPGEIWGLNPTTGKLAWFVETELSGNLSPSVIVDDKTIYAFGGYRSSGSLAVNVSGDKGDLSDSNVLWTSRSSSYVATPVLLNGRLHWIDNKGIYYCTDAATGELVHRERTPGITGGRQLVYASAIAINGKIYFQTRTSGTIVIDPSDKLNIVAHNKFAEDSSQFNATPAVDNGQLFLRSDQYLYCVGN